MSLLAFESLDKSYGHVPALRNVTFEVREGEVFGLLGPNGADKTTLIRIPFSAPTVVVFRMSMEPNGIAWWEVLGSFGVLGLCTWLALRLGARLSRVGLLLGGGRPRLLEIIRQARLST